MIASNPPSRGLVLLSRFRVQAFTPAKWFNIVIGLLITIPWWARLVRSFWVDEASTYFIAHQGWWVAAQRSAEWPGQSVLYGIIASLFCVGTSPWKEILLRVPSLAAIVLAAVFLYKIAERLTGRGSGAVAVCVFLVDPAIVGLGSNARVYALAIAACVVSCWAFVEWFEFGRKKDLLIFVAASIAVLYLHYFFGFIFMFQFAYVLFLRAQGRSVPLKATVAGFVLIAVSLLPLVPLLRVLVRQSTTLSFAGQPKVTDLGDALAPAVLVVVGVIAALLAKLTPCEVEFKPPFAERASVLFLSLWWLLGPVVFFLIATVTPFEVFVPRYTSFARPAISLLFACFVSYVLTVRERRAWLLAFVAISVLNPIVLQSYWQLGKYECRPALDIAEQRAGYSAVPILLTSDLPESNAQDWMLGVVKKPHLFTALTAYPVRNPVYGLPYQVDDNMKAFMQRLTSEDLRPAQRIVMVSALPDTVEWVEGYLRSLGYRSTKERPNSYAVVTFEKSGTVSQP